MAQSTGGGATQSRLETQLDRLVEEGCCATDEMIVFPISADSSSLAEFSRHPGMTVERIGPDVVRIRRATVA